MIQDDIDERQGVGAMNVDNVEEQDGAWINTGTTLTGKGPDGEDTLFVLQRRGGATRIVPNGKGKGKAK